MDTIEIPYGKLIEIAKKDLLKELAIWLKLKMLFRKHTIIYNFSYPRISKLTNIPVPTLMKYIPRLIDLGWVEIHAGNLLLVSFWRVIGNNRTRKKGIIEISRKMRFGEVLDRLRALLIEYDYKVQNFRVGLSSGRLNVKAKLQSKFVEKYGYQNGKGKVILTSCRRIANQCNLSPSAVLSLIGRLNRLKILRLKPLIQVISDGCQPSSCYHAEDYGFVFWKKGTLFVNRGTVISLVYSLG